MCSYNTTKKTIRRVSFDSDGTPFIMNNSANCHICSDKSCFVELHMLTEAKKEFSRSRGTMGSEAMPNGFGNMQLTWMHEKGNNYTCTINDVHHMPESPVNLVEVTKFGKQIEPKEE